MGKKKKNRRPPSLADRLFAELDQRMEMCMGYNASAFSESAARWFDAQYAALRSLRDWLCDEDE